jgi:hypothetical protein
MSRCTYESAAKVLFIVPQSLAVCDVVELMQQLEEDDDRRFT